MIKVVFQVVKKLPDVFNGKNSMINKRANGKIILFSKFKLKLGLFLKKIFCQFENNQNNYQ